MFKKSLLLLTLLCYFAGPLVHAKDAQPNIVIIFLDDSGYGDFHPFGNPNYSTPNVEQLAKEGTVFTQFYVPQAICSASRSALMSGCYPARTKVFGAHGNGGRGLEPKFAIMPEQLKKTGYRTALFGKWHIGDQEDTRPLARGFDEHAGFMYSNDMWKHHPNDPKKHWAKHPLVFWENGKQKIPDVDHKHQTTLTKDLTHYAVDFINRQGDKPFFLYLAHPMPHVPIYASPEFQGKSGLGLYADVMTELDWSVGQVQKALKEKNFADNTIVIFSSDNGPWASYGNHAGATPFREAKATSFDGGMHVACIVKYPNVLKSNHVSKRTFFSIDFMPTLMNWAGAPLPDNEIDGMDVASWISEKSESNPHAFYGFSIGNEAQGVISGDGKWKLHVAHDYRTVTEFGKDGQAGTYDKRKQPLALYHLAEDPMESIDVKDKYPEVFERMHGYAQKHLSMIKTNY